MNPLRLGVIGAGQVWRRLYEPALQRTQHFRVAGTADPDEAAGAMFTTTEALFEDTALDCVIVLSPPSLHHAHVIACIQHGLPVLVEKPPALSVAEIDGWETAGGSALVRPSFSRRYWEPYARNGRNGHHWDFTLHTSPAAWSASTIEPVEHDLLPHAVDLARWLSGEEVAHRTVSHRSPDKISGSFELSGGGRFAWEVAHGTDYREVLLLDGKAVAVQEPLLSRLRRRLVGGPERPVAAITGMLNDWALAISGSTPLRLAGFADARANAAVIEDVLSARVEERS